MSCSKCKNKKQIRDPFDGQSDSITKKLMWGFIVWSVFALYGVYTLISKFL